MAILGAIVKMKISLVSASAVSRPVSAPASSKLFPAQYVHAHLPAPGNDKSLARCVQESGKHLLPENAANQGAKETAGVPQGDKWKRRTGKETARGAF
jgi:hypothetical protein